jgi:hypothetical protein
MKIVELLSLIFDKSPQFGVEEAIKCSVNEDLDLLCGRLSDENVELVEIVLSAFPSKKDGLGDEFIVKDMDTK